MSMKALPVKPDDVLICMIDEWGKGEKDAFDCHITSIRKNGVDVLYLSGYRSRNDFVPWADVVARVNLALPRIPVANGIFVGHFELFHQNQPTPDDTQKPIPQCNDGRPGPGLR